MRVVTTVADLLGAALIVAGVAMLSVPVALLVAGGFILAASRQVAR
jgi:hypothetical protein